MTTPDIICQTRGPCGLITLNRPLALNALTHDMVREIAAALDLWATDAAITRVVINAADGKAFSAGGDIRALYAEGRAGEHAGQIAFWRDEYALNLRIKTYPKPYVALIDGIVMGGGAGVSINGSHVIAGERFSFAMPEVGIGFFPDVGATYFLPRLPGRWGMYLALTGARVNAALAVRLGLARAVVPDMAGLLAHLLEGANVDASIARWSVAPASAPANEDWITTCFGAETVSDIVARLAALAEQGHAGAVQAQTQIAAKSPTSLAIACQQMQMGVGLSMQQALTLEFRIVARLCRGPDFYEGVRALVIDRDNRPLWQPATLDEVDPHTIAAFFAVLPEGDLFEAGHASSPQECDI